MRSFAWRKCPERQIASAVTVAILKQGEHLIASIQSALRDHEVLELRDELAHRVGALRARGIVIDVTALDVIDSFVARSLRTIALTAKLRGAETVIVGIQPEVAVAMVQFKLNLEPLHAALDLEEGLELLGALKQESAHADG
jgi:rsbT antagonist protein RsbS